MKIQNPISKLFAAVAEVVNTYTRRAVTTGDIWHYIQDELDVQAVVDAGSVHDAMNMPRSYVIDIYVDSESIYALITKSDGKLYKAPVTVSADIGIQVGEYQEVVMEFAPVADRSITVKRSADGVVRWFAMPACTAVLNRVGEIDSTVLFDSFIEYAERTNIYPELDFWHARDIVALGKADWVGREGVAYCASGLFYDTPIAQAAAKSLEEDKDYWGISIDYLPIKNPKLIRSQDGIEIPVFNAGINRFISLLPENAAASILTNISTKEEVNRMNDKMKAALKKLTGDDETLFDEIALKLDTVIRQSEGMISRGTPATPDAQTPSLEEQVTAIVEKVLAAKVVPAPAVEPTAIESDNELREMIRTLTEKVDKLNEDREAQITEILNDLPAKITRQQIVRPRAAVMPDSFATQRPVDMAQIAKQTLEKMEQSQA